ncbi:hypothetical protein VNO77_20983 [Canavalia gladiata]|uniref:TIR domain-containing protein n=1 Tax=Canavalia gladiata TaxID=3824 RepID=A0AAN9QMZ1_CANGL
MGSSSFSSSYSSTPRSWSYDVFLSFRGEDTRKGSAIFPVLEGDPLHEAELVESIAQHIHKMLIPKLPFCTENFVGMASKGTEAIQGIVLNMLQRYEERWNTNAFSNTSQLKFLILNGMKLNSGLDCLPRSLKVLHWRGCSLKSLPLTNQPYDFVDIKLSLSKLEELWNGEKVEFGKSMKSLTLLSLQGSAVQKLPTSLGCLAGLELLNLEDCKLLVSLPKTICRLHSLKELLLSGCFKFQNLPEFGESMKHLSKVSLDETAIREVPSSLGCLVGVVNLSLTNCKNLICLPDIFDRLKSLTHLSTYGCSELGKLSSAMNEGPRIGLPHSILSLPSLVVLNLRNCSLSEESIRHDFCDLPSLQKLDLSHNNFTVVPINISKLPKLQYLGLCFCPKLQRLPELPPSIIRLNASNCYSLEISEFNPCNLFTSLGPHPPKVGSFDMLITGEKIPSWFVHREDGEYVSVPFNCPLNDSVGIAVCFLLISYARPSENFLYTVECCLDSRLGKHIMERQLSWIKPGCPHLYVLLLTGHEFNDQIHQDSRFGLFQKAKVFSQFDGQCRDPNLLDLKIVCCGSRLLYMQDIEVLNHSIEQFSEGNINLNITLHNQALVKKDLATRKRSLRRRKKKKIQMTIRFKVNAFLQKTKREIKLWFYILSRRKSSIHSKS